MRISARQLRQALNKLPDPNQYPRDIVNVRLPPEARPTGGRLKGHEAIVTFTRRQYDRYADWTLEVT